MTTTLKKRTNLQSYEYGGLPPVSGVGYRVIDTLSALEKLSCQWEKIQPSPASAPMQQADWLMSCLQSFTTDTATAVYLPDTQHDLSAISVLVRKAGAAAPYELPGLTELYEPTELIYKDQASLNSLLQALSKLKRPLVLARVPADSPVPDAVRQLFRNKAMVRCTRVDGCPVIALDGTDPEARLATRLRSDLRRARRKAQAHGKVSVDIVKPVSEAQFLPVFEEALEVEADGWKQEAGTALAVDAERRRFFRDYGVRASKRGLLRVAFLRIDGNAVAMQLAVESASRFWLLKVGYREQYANCSPGLLLMLETLRYASKQGLLAYELLGTPAAWTRRWTTVEHPNVLIEIYPFTIASLLCILKKARNRLGARRGT